MSGPITVMAVDAHPIFLEGLASAIGGAPELRLVAQVGSGIQALERYRQLRPDVTLMDIRLPGMDGIDTIAAIRAEFPSACILVLSTSEGDGHALRAIRAGAAGYLLKSMERGELLDSIRYVHAGRRHIPQRIADAIALQAPADALSRREIQVLELAAAGRGNRRIGAELGIAEDTVKVHMRKIMAKLQASDRTHAVTIALGRGILDLPSPARQATA